MARLRAMFAVGAIVGGAALLTALPAAAAPNPGVTPGQCVNSGGNVSYFVGPHGESDGHGVCQGGRLNGQQLADPSGRPGVI